MRNNIIVALQYLSPARGTARSRIFKPVEDAVDRQISRAS